MKNQTTFNECQVTELELYIMNTRKPYFSLLKPYFDQLIKKSAKGIYNKDKALKGFYSIVHESSKLYSKEYGSGRDYLQMFTPTDKKEVCERLESYYIEEIAPKNIIEETQTQEQSLELVAR